MFSRTLLAAAGAALALSTLLHPAAASPVRAQPAFTPLPPPLAEERPMFGGAWRPDESTRVLFVLPPELLEQAAGAGSGALPAALRLEGERVARELAQLGLLAAAPPVLLAAEAELADFAGPSDLVLNLSGQEPPAPDARPQPQTDRAEISQAGAEPLRVQAADATGLFRGTRAVLQWLVGTGEVPSGRAVFAFESPVRSVHIDIARKHYPVESLERLLHDMSWLGMNELELHFSENEGFRIESERHPEVQSETVLTKREVEELIALAGSLHIRITPSLDMPGHLDHVLRARPELRLRAADGSEVYGALDLSNPEAKAFTFDLIDEYAELFEPGRWNLGADEFVEFEDENEVAKLTAAARAEHGQQAAAFDAMTSFVNEAAARLAEKGFTTRVWSDGMLRGRVVPLDPAVEVAYWTSRPDDVEPVERFVQNGNALLNVNDEYLYFVLGERVEYFYPSGEEILEQWRPEVFPGPGEPPQIAGEEAEVSGGMFAIWSDVPEALTDAEVVDRARAPLRATAVRLAAPEAELDWEDFSFSSEAIGRAPELRLESPGSSPARLVTPGATPVGTAPQMWSRPWAWVGAAAALVALAAGALVLLRRRAR